MVFCVLPTLMFMCCTTLHTETQQLSTKKSLSLLSVHMADWRPQPCRGLLTVVKLFLNAVLLIPPCFPQCIILILALKSLMNTSHFAAFFHQNIWYTSLLQTLINLYWWQLVTCLNVFVQVRLTCG